MWLVLLIVHVSQSTKVPADSRVDYFCRLQRYDIIVQALADGKKRFLDIATGFSGFLRNDHML